MAHFMDDSYYYSDRDYCQAHRLRGHEMQRADRATVSGMLHRLHGQPESYERKYAILTLQKYVQKY